MNKAQVSITYLFEFLPEDVGISLDSSEREFEAAINGYLNRIFEETESSLGVPNDIEIYIE